MDYGCQKKKDEKDVNQLSDRPNILLITTDQQRYDTVSALGYPHMHTPNLDRLVQEGCAFRNAYSPNPVCMAARHNILTGLTARYHGFDDNYFDEARAIPYNLPTFPQILTDGGEYDAIAIGKMHFQPCRRHNGFSRMELMEEIPRCRDDDDYALFLKQKGYSHIQSLHGVRHLLYMQPQQSFLPEECHGTRWVADRAISYIEENAGKRPFLAWVSFIAPHPPLDVPERFSNLYFGRTIPDAVESETPLSKLAQENSGIADYPSSQYLRRFRELYYSAISYVDENIGRILDTLVKVGELDNTLIIFTSDHGEMLGDHGTYQKFLPYDGAAKIPMIMRYMKKLKPGSVCDEFMDLNDLFPTILDVAGCSYTGKWKLPGESVFSIDREKDREYQYVEYGHGNRRWISLRNQRFKYNYYYGGGYEELFDMELDPYERRNLLLCNCDEKVVVVKKQLYERLVQYETEYGLEGYVEDGKLKVLEDYQIHYYQEMNFPMHTKMLQTSEQKMLLPMQTEIRMAIEREPVVQIGELKLDEFKKNSGLSEAEVEKLVRAARDS